MKILCVIPARYGSSRLPGKPLADICGKPMIWWVYQQVSKIENIDIVVATDDERIVAACDSFNIPSILTGDHKTHINRIHEVSTRIDADYYVCVCGDEPLIDPETIKKVFPESVSEELHVSALMRELTEPTEVNDPGNIKIVTNKDSICVMLSRSPIPFPYKTIMYRYKKIVGVECYNKKALDYFASTEIGPVEKIEDVTLLRFLENGIKMKSTLTDTQALSVDTERDLEKIRHIIGSKTAMD